MPIMPLLYFPSSNIVVSSPNDVANCVLWLDADLSSKSYSSGSNISQWNDLSGNNNHAATSNGTPNYQTSRDGSKSAIAFNNARMLFTNYGYLTSEFTIVLRARQNTNGGMFLYSYGASNGDEEIAIGASSSGTKAEARIYDNSAYQYRVNYDHSLDVFHTFTFSAKSGDTANQYLDGTLVNFDPAGTFNISNTNAKGSSLGGYYRDNNYNTNAEIRAIAIYDRALSSAVIQQVEAII